jgi:hypothetical protein
VAILFCSRHSNRARRYQGKEGTELSFRRRKNPAADADYATVLEVLALFQDERLPQRLPVVTVAVVPEGRLSIADSVCQLVDAWSLSN